MITTSVQDVLKWLELNQLEFWTVSRTKTGNSKVFEPLDDETLIERRNRFVDTMRLLPATWYIVSAKRVKNQTTGMFEYEFTNGDTGTSSSQNAVGNIPTVIQGIPKEEVSELIRQAIEEEKRKNELEELRKENKTLKKELDENGGAIGRILKKTEPIIGMMIEKFLPIKPAIQLAGLEYDHSNENTETVESDVIYNEMTDDETMARIQAAIQTWSDADAEFLPVLEFIADFAASGKTIDAGFVKLDYNTVKSMLK